MTHPASRSLPKKTDMSAKNELPALAHASATHDPPPGAVTRGEMGSDRSSATHGAGRPAADEKPVMREPVPTPKSQRDGTRDVQRG